MAKLKIGLEYHLEHIIDWSVIWHNFDVIESSRRRKEEREERKNDKRIVATKESLKGSRKESSVERDATCPTLLVLRQEDGAVRPEKRQVLETQQRVVVGAIKASPVVKKKLAVEKKTELSAQRKIQPCSAETKRNANLTRNERIARLEVKVALETLEKEDGAVRPEEKTTPLCRNQTKREGATQRTKRSPC